MPWTSGSALSRSISASSSASVVCAGRSKSMRADADLLRGAALVAHVDARSRIVADQHHRQPGPRPCRPPRARRPARFRLSSSSSAMRLPSRMRAVCWRSCGLDGRCARVVAAHYRPSVAHPRLSGLAAMTDPDFETTQIEAAAFRRLLAAPDARAHRRAEHRPDDPRRLLPQLPGRLVSRSRRGARHHA